MKIDCKFKGLDHSQAFTEYIADRCEKLKKFEIKPIKVNVTISEEGHQKVSEIHFKGIDSNYKAKGYGDCFHSSFDTCLAKIVRQMDKEKQKIKKHKNFQRSSSGKLRHLNEQLEFDYKKAG